MDFIKKVAGGNKDSKAAPVDGQKEDYVDKAFDAISKKAGINIDRNTEEKITDAGRDMYEKQTGQKVNPKISN